LHIAAAAAFGEDAGMISVLHYYAAVSGERVVYVHAAFGVMKLATCPSARLVIVPPFLVWTVLLPFAAGILFPPLEPKVFPPVAPVAALPPVELAGSLRRWS
jgi:hypothetical protein